MKKRSLALLAVLAAGLVMFSAYADSFLSIVIGSGTGVTNVIWFKDTYGAIQFDGLAAVGSFDDMGISANDLSLYGAGDLNMNAAAGMSIAATDSATIATRGMLTGFGEGGVSLWSAPFDCLSPLEGEACVEDMRAFYMGNMEGEVPEGITEVSLRTGSGAVSLATVDGNLQTRSALYISDDGSATMQSDIASDEGDRLTDPRASLTCTRDGDVIIQLGGEAQSSESLQSSYAPQSYGQSNYYTPSIIPPEAANAAKAALERPAPATPWTTE